MIGRMNTFESYVPLFKKSDDREEKRARRERKERKAHRKREEHYEQNPDDYKFPEWRKIAPKEYWPTRAL